MNVPARCDVAVIGGGPAGSTAATLLARKGYSVVLFDKEKHPRYVVGESLIPHFWKYCDMSGATAPLEAEGFIHKTGGTVVWNGAIRQMAFSDFGFKRPALHVERDRFDHIVLLHARTQGVQVFEEVAVLKVDLDAGGRTRVSVRATGEDTVGTLECRFVIDASGQNAVLAKQTGTRVIDDGFRFMSIWGYFDNSKYIGLGGKVHPFSALKTEPPTTFVCSVDELGEWGWLWHIPLRTSTSVGLVMPQEKLKAVKESDEALEQYFLRKCAEIPYLNRLLESARYKEGTFHVIRDYSYRNAVLAGPGYFLIGDAAAFVDPIFSVGIVFAMYSAWAAAWAIDRSFRRAETTAGNQGIYASQVSGRLEMSRALALPLYTSRGAASDLARATVQFESTLEKELMFVVATLTTRNENVKEMVKDRGGDKVTSSRYRALDEIIF
jgi:flavin-dependent dehydrogenase